VTQAANMFHALGAEKGDVISFMLPLVPDAFGRCSRRGRPASPITSIPA